MRYSWLCGVAILTMFGTAMAADDAAPGKGFQGWQPPKSRQEEGCRDGGKSEQHNEGGSEPERWVGHRSHTALACGVAQDIRA